MEQEKKLNLSLPLLPVEDSVILPGVIVEIGTVNEETGAALESIGADPRICMVNRNYKEEENSKEIKWDGVGILGILQNTIRKNGKIVKAYIKGEKRCILLDDWKEENYSMGQVMELEDDLSELPLHDPDQLAALTRELIHFYDAYAKEEFLSDVTEEEMRDPARLVHYIDRIAMRVMVGSEQKKYMLSQTSVLGRYEYLMRFLHKEMEWEDIARKIHWKVQQNMDDSQKVYYLREQLKVIREELGEGNDPKSDRRREQLEKLECSDEVRERILEEIQRVESAPENSMDSAASKDYIDMLLSLPWDHKEEEAPSLEEAYEILEKEHFGLNKVKERIMEHLAVRKLTKNADAPILCLVGPPGTGKTSVAQSIAKAICKPYVRICLGGVRDEAEIRGHRKTYIGAMPGNIVKGLRTAKVKDPFILLDEIDKVSNDYRGDTFAALLEVLDPEQNRNFMDHYVDIPIDLSEAFFLCTANSVHTIPRPLLDRMEILELSGYTGSEKFHIGKDFLVPKQRSKNGLGGKDIGFRDTAIEEIIQHYTRESGVRELERQIATVCRKVARKKAEGQEKKVSVTKKNVKEYLGIPKYYEESTSTRSQVGIVKGLAWTQVGGEILYIETLLTRGKGELVITGQLGDVMKESAQLAVSLVKHSFPERAELFEKNDLHIHVPDGATPKDGPSAGITLTTALSSLVTESPVDPHICMTGEVSLEGKVKPIGRLPEKLMAAHRAGCTKAFIPRDNEGDLKDVAAEVKEALTIIPVDSVKDVLKLSGIKAPRKSSKASSGSGRTRR